MSDRQKAAPAAVGSVGIPHYSGFLSVESDRRLSGLKGPQMWREMSEGNATVGAALYAFESLVKATGYRIEPADETPAAEQSAAFLSEALDDMDGAWSDTLSDILSCRPYGFSLLVPIYKTRTGPTGDRATNSMYSDGRIGWRRWMPLAQETITRWDIPENEAVGFWQQAPPKNREERIDLSRVLHFMVRGRKGSPEGLSCLRNAFEAYYYLKNIMRIEAIGIERDLAGLPVAYIPAEVISAAGPVYEAYRTMVTDVRRDEQAGVVMPSDVYEGTTTRQYEFSLMATAGTHQIDTDKVIARYERYILRSLLTDWLTMGDTGVGSYAQSVNRTDIFLQSVKGELQGIEEVINVQAVRPLFGLNGLSLDTMPRFVFQEVSRDDLASMATILGTLVDKGFVDPTEPDLKQWVLDFFGMPSPVETDEQAADETGAKAAIKRNKTGDFPAEKSPPAPEDEPETPPKERAFAEKDESEITEQDLIDAAAWFDKQFPTLKGMLNAKVEGGDS